MSPAASQPGSPNDWLNHARSDLNLGKLAKDDPDVLPEQACFHAQQACEKALKAVLLSKGLEFPPVHDIEVLLEIAQQGKVDLPNEAQEAASLTPYAVEMRYPGSEEGVTPEDVGKAIQLAERLVSWASKLVKKQ